MIFLTAQPDDYYFQWQLEVQLYNLSKMGVNPNSIHVLVGYNQARNIKPSFRAFMEENKSNACFFPYPDNRVEKKYLSSLRPNLIKQHFKSLPELEVSPIFYHDSDIIFREMPDFDQMLNDDNWYISNTQNYLNINLIERAGNKDLFNQMCRVIGVLPNEIIKKNKQMGGAQYLLKNTTYLFWDKVEKDCEALYKLMATHNAHAKESSLLADHADIEYKPVMAWCADMWALLWNAWLHKHNTIIHKELDFCWPNDPFSAWEKTKILHYSGVLKKEDKVTFCKSEYIHYSPYYDNFDTIKKHTCSEPLVKLIKQYERNVMSPKKEALQDVTFVFYLSDISSTHWDNLEIITTYLYKFFQTNILILETPPVHIRNPFCFPSICQRKVISTQIPISSVLTKIPTEIIAIYNGDLVLTAESIINSINLVKTSNISVITGNSNVFKLDRLFKSMFSKILDDKLLIYNQNKFTKESNVPYGIAFIKKQDYSNIQINASFNDFSKYFEELAYMTETQKEPMRANDIAFHLPY